MPDCARKFGRPLRQRKQSIAELICWVHGETSKRIPSEKLYPAGVHGREASTRRRGGWGRGGGGGGGRGARGGGGGGRGGGGGAAGGRGEEELEAGPQTRAWQGPMPQRVR